MSGRRAGNLVSGVGLLLMLTASAARGWILGNRGDMPVKDNDWAAGSVELANLPTRVGFWEGPPFGSGQYHFLYRGDAAAFQEAVDQFGKINAPELRLVVREGREESFWLKGGEDRAGAQVDWTFIVWTPRNWHQLFNNPLSTFGSDAAHGEFGMPVAPPTMEVNVAGPDGVGIDWSKVKVPAGVTVVDERATANGYAREDGSVVVGQVFDMRTSKAVAGATVSLAGVKDGADAETFGTKADDGGRFVQKKLAAGAYRVTFSAVGYAPRTFSVALRGNTFRRLTVLLGMEKSVQGRVADPSGKPLSGVTVRPTDVFGMDGRVYAGPERPEEVTGAQGEFTLTGLPEGYLRLVASHPTHMAEGLELHPIGGGIISVVMTETGRIRGKVLHPDGTPAVEGTVQAVVAGTDGSRVGTWSGGTTVKKDGSFEFERVPPGSYTVSADPRMLRAGKEEGAKTVEVKAGAAVEVQLTGPGRVGQGAGGGELP